MRSLRSRLLTGIVATMLLTWAGLFLWYRAEVTREWSGEWDATLREVAHLTLLSLPVGLENSIADGGFSLPGEQRLDTSQLQMTFQVWNLATRRSVLHSPTAPGQPIVPDMREGYATIMVGGEPWRVYAVSDASGRIQVQVGKPQSLLRKELQDRLTRGLLFVGFLACVLACVVGCVVQWSVFPVTRLSRRILQRRPTDLQPLPARELPVELRPLVESFNGLLGRLDEAMQNERRFLVDAAHELRTPLAVLTVQTENALRCQDPVQLRAELDKLLATTQRSARLSEQLLDMARLDANGFGEDDVELHTVVSVIARDFETSAAERGQRISLDAEVCLVRGRVDPLGILVRNLVDNAVRYGGRNAHIAVACRSEADSVLLTVADDGPGVPESEYRRIFDRFYRVAGTTERGSGIGLSLVAQIAESHAASIQVGAGLYGRGLRVHIRFPSAPAA
ncbi:MAG: two-component sensor histidine kinase [Alcaligenaceae bacterium]|nr:two-component sensor histidine kinase [Alcaligenaceae bacterium SAGV5]MPS54329.1 two-component sensor histidine kinase [Alcaligenaceae bacterium SAGV3]MPT55261.1 two-component sensor histidine kinase [Alcaligenaceae bacterium]